MVIAKYMVINCKTEKRYLAPSGKWIKTKRLAAEHTIENAMKIANDMQAFVETYNYRD